MLIWPITSFDLLTHFFLNCCKFVNENSTERRHIIGNRNRKLARPSSKTTPSKCLNNAINQQLKGGNKLRNGTTSKVSNDNNNNNLMIDDCGEPQGSNKNNKKSSNNNNDIAMNAIGSEVRERNVDFIEEWMNTFAFLSREFFYIIFSLFYSFSYLLTKISF